jgi:hypothetical protein
MEAIVDASNETIWATQKAMAELFGIDLSGVSRHISNIYDIGELERDTTLAKFATPVQSGFRGIISKEIEYYNLDIIIAVGYRINSVKATAFRRWATSILKQYMIKGYAVNQNAVSEQKYEDPNLVSALTGHVEGSRAFTRYRTIDIDMKRDLVKILEGKH